MEGRYKHRVLENFQNPQIYTYTNFDEGRDIQINVIPTFIAEKSAPQNDYYFFAYEVEVHNLGSEEVQLISRHWIIRDGNKRERFINGEGVIGQRPKIESGDHFSYQSFCPLSTPTGNMRGKYEFQTLSGKKFWVSIPLFFFRTPDSFIQ